MKFIGLIGLFAFVSTVHAAPVFCGASTSPYQVSVSNNHATATVTINGEKPMFGDLVCSPLKNEGAVGEAFLRCQSPNVADAGYTAVFRRTDSGSEVKLEESWIGGSHHRATLPCVHAQN